MEPSSALGRERRRGRCSPGRILFTVVLVVTALFLAWRVLVLGVLEAHFGSGYDDRRFDTLEARFDHRRDAFAEADARMSELAAAHPRAERIGWSLALVCVRDPGRAADSCEPTSARDKSTYEALHGVDVIVRQSKDADLTFYRFYGDDPPRYTLLHAPTDTDVSAYADDRGFRSTRSLTPGWTLLGPIPDVHREEEQWRTG